MERVILMVFKVKRNSEGAWQQVVLRGGTPSSKCFGPYLLTLLGAGPHPGHDSRMSTDCLLFTFPLLAEFFSGYSLCDICGP